MGTMLNMYVATDQRMFGCLGAVCRSRFSWESQFAISLVVSRMEQRMMELVIGNAVDGY